MCSSDVPGGVSTRRMCVRSFEDGQAVWVRNWRTMAVFLGPRQITAVERVERMKPRDITERRPLLDDCDSLWFPCSSIVVVGDDSEVGSISDASWTMTAPRPPSTIVTFLSSMPKKRGAFGPVRSRSRTPTLYPWRENERASCVVTDDLPTPPLPERTRTMLSTWSNGIFIRLQTVCDISRISFDNSSIICGILRTMTNVTL